MNYLDDAIQQLDVLIAKLVAADPSPSAKSGGQKTVSSRAVCLFAGSFIRSPWDWPIFLMTADISYDRAESQHTKTSVTQPKAAPQVEASGHSNLADPDVHVAKTSAQKPKAKKEKQPAVKVPVVAVPDSGAVLFARAQLQACSLAYKLPLQSPDQS